MMIQSLARAVISTFLVAWVLKKVHRNLFSLILTIFFVILSSILFFTYFSVPSISTTSSGSSNASTATTISTSAVSPSLVHSGFRFVVFDTVKDVVSILQYIIIEFQDHVRGDVDDLQSLIFVSIFASVFIMFIKHYLKLQFISWISFVIGFITILPLFSNQQGQKDPMIAIISYYLAILFAFIGPISSRGAALFVTFEYTFTLTRILLINASSAIQPNSNSHPLATEYEYRSVEAGVVAAFACLFYDLVLVLLLPMLGRILHVSCHVYGALVVARSLAEVLSKYFPKSLKPIDHSIILPTPGSNPLTWSEALDVRNAFDISKNDQYFFVQLPPLVFIVYAFGMTLRIATIASSGVTARDVDTDTDDNEQRVKRKSIVAGSQNLDIYAIAVSAMRSEKHRTKVLIAYLASLSFFVLITLLTFVFKGGDTAIATVTDIKFISSVFFSALIVSELLIGDLTLTRKSLLQLGSTFFSGQNTNPDIVVNPLATSGIFDDLIFDLLGVDKQTGYISHSIAKTVSKSKHRKANSTIETQSSIRELSHISLSPDFSNNQPPLVVQRSIFSSKSDPKELFKMEASQLLKESEEAKRNHDFLRNQIFRMNALLYGITDPEAMEQKKAQIKQLEANSDAAEKLYNEKYQAWKVANEKLTAQ